MLSYKRPKAIREGSPASDEISSSNGSIQDNVTAIKHRDLKVSQSSDSDDNDEIDHFDEEEEAAAAAADETASESPSSPANDLSSISFGALARAQASLSGTYSSKKRKRPSSSSSSSDGHPPAHASTHPTTHDDHNAEALERRAGKKDDRKHTRLSKHAPTELSSKKAVSRKRSVVPVPKREARDPRFESVLGPINEQKIKSNYAFLDGYRDSELQSLKARIKTTRSVDEKERLKREVLRMESRRKAQERKDAEQEVRRRHRKEEKAKVEAGKTPFYLKKAEVKKEALVERYRGMKGKEVEKLLERRQKKKAGKEKRNLPRVRRVDAG